MSEQFMKTLHDLGYSADRLPVVLFRSDADGINTLYLSNHYYASTYFHSQTDLRNRAFLTSFSDLFGVAVSPTRDTITAYNAVHMFALAVTKGGSFHTSDIQAAMYGLTFSSPAGDITMNVNHWLTQYFRIGKYNDAAQSFEVVFSSLRAKMPKVFHFLHPTYRTRACDLRSHGGVYAVSIFFWTLFASEEVLSLHSFCSQDSFLLSLLSKVES